MPIMKNGKSKKEDIEVNLQLEQNDENHHDESLLD